MAKVQKPVLLVHQKDAKEMADLFEPLWTSTISVPGGNAIELRSLAWMAGELLTAAAPENRFRPKTDIESLHDLFTALRYPQWHEKYGAQQPIEYAELALLTDPAPTFKEAAKRLRAYPPELSNVQRATLFKLYGIEGVEKVAELLEQAAAKCTPAHEQESPLTAIQTILERLAVEQDVSLAQRAGRGGR